MRFVSSAAAAVAAFAMAVLTSSTSTYALGLSVVSSTDVTSSTMPGGKVMKTPTTRNNNNNSNNNKRSKMLKTTKSLLPRMLQNEACGFEDEVNDGYCDPLNNNAGCNYDGADCCGADVDKSFCTEDDGGGPNSALCQCRDPSKSPATGQPVKSPTEIPSPTGPPVKSPTEISSLCPEGYVFECSGLSCNCNEEENDNMTMIFIIVGAAVGAIILGVGAVVLFKKKSQPSAVMFPTAIVPGNAGPGQAGSMTAFPSAGAGSMSGGFPSGTNGGSMTGFPSAMSSAPAGYHEPQSYTLTREQQQQQQLQPKPSLKQLEDMM